MISFQVLEMVTVAYRVLNSNFPFRPHSWFKNEQLWNKPGDEVKMTLHYTLSFMNFKESPFLDLIRHTLPQSKNEISAK